MINKEKAFTLAEVLITLGVIGVVAALTLPTVIQNYQKQVTINKLKKVYTKLNQAVKMSEIDNDAFENWSKISDEVTEEEFVNKYFKPYLEIIKTCNNAQKCGYKTSTPFKNLNNHYLYFTSYGIILKDGTYIGFTKALNKATLFIDINGTAQPNKYGRDFFMFHIIPLKGVVPSGYNHVIDTYCSKDYNRYFYRLLQKVYETQGKYLRFPLCFATF